MKEYIIRVDETKQDFMGGMRVTEKKELVRCGYCMHSIEWYRDKRRCFLWDENGIDVFEDGFCNYGKKRDDNA